MSLGGWGSSALGFLYGESKGLEHILSAIVKIVTIGDP